MTWQVGNINEYIYKSFILLQDIIIKSILSPQKTTDLLKVPPQCYKEEIIIYEND